MMAANGQSGFIRIQSIVIVRRFKPAQRHGDAMKSKNLTQAQIYSVTCPTCGVAAGKRCVLHSGAERTPHIDRRFSAAEKIEKQRVRRACG